MSKFLLQKGSTCRCFFLKLFVMGMVVLADVPKAQTKPQPPSSEISSPSKTPTSSKQSSVSDTFREQRAKGKLPEREVDPNLGPSAPPYIHRPHPLVQGLKEILEKMKDALADVRTSIQSWLPWGKQRNP